MIPQSTTATKSGFPYLVDIKISEYCPFACQFCYQSSTKEGAHAESYFLQYTLADYLAKVGVFNVCFGGGEPTLYNTGHTRLEHILSSYKRRGFVTSFTTKNYNMHKLSNFDDIIKHADAIAISANTLEELSKAVELKKHISNATSPCSVYVQTILELLPWEETQQWFDEACKHWFRGITFLGYKSFGFGVNETPNTVPDDWFEYFKGKRASVGIDSVLATKYKDQLITGGVQEYKLVGTDGLSTCYVDAVKKTVARNSFCDDVHAFDTRTFMNIFKSFK